MLIDSHGRKVSYLRLSITDRCNLRCLYCRPQSEWHFLPHEQILTFEEMFDIMRPRYEEAKKRAAVNSTAAVKRGCFTTKAESTGV